MKHSRMVAVLMSIALVAELSGRQAAARNTPMPGKADVQVMVFPAEMFRGWPGRQAIEDHVTLTYARAVPRIRRYATFWRTVRSPRVR